MGNGKPKLRVVRPFAVARITIVLLSLMMLSSCKTVPPPDPQAKLIAQGREIFFNETFDGNGRTCGSCHPAENNFTIDPAFIATLPKDDPLFVAEFIPALKDNFENPRLMREFGLILDNPSFAPGGEQSTRNSGRSGGNGPRGEKKGSDHRQDVILTPLPCKPYILSCWGMLDYRVHAR